MADEPTRQPYSGTYVTWGPPGTGKTTWISRQVQEVVRRVPVDVDRPMSQQRAPVIVCSLTKTAASEAAGRVSDVLPREMVGTLHSFAYRALDRPEIAEGHLKEWNESAPAEWRLPNVQGDLNAPKEGDEGKGVEQGAALLQEYQRLRAMRVDVWSLPPSEQRNLVPFVEAWETWKNENGYLDFGDLIAKARFTAFAPGRPHVILVDEAQDYSAAEWAVVEAWAQNTDALMVAGDPYQCLYEWRGADPEVMFRYADQGRSKLLNRSRRLPRAVHAVATRWVTNLTYHRAADWSPKDADGEVVDNRKLTLKSPNALIDTLRPDLDAGKHVMVAVTCGYMLNALLAVMRQRGIPFANPRRRRRRDWNPLAPGRGVQMWERAVAFSRIDPSLWGPKAGVWSNAEMALWAPVVSTKGGPLRHGAKKRIEQLAEADGEAPIAELVEPEALECIARMVKAAKRRAAGDGKMMAWWARHTKKQHRELALYLARCVATMGTVDAIRDRPRLSIGTIHSFKGYEADVVYLFPDLSPQGLDAWHTKRGSDTMADAKRNAVVRQFYVGMTRAKEKLVLCGMARKGSGVDWSSDGSKGVEPDEQGTST